MKTSLVLSILLGSFLALGGCSGAPKTSTTTQGTGETGDTGGTTYGTGDDDVGTGDGDGEGMSARGNACPDDASCPDGMQCITYYGIAGMSGPAFTSCEDPCGKGQTCPDGLTCMTIADGPGQVCR
jgi:hypothetical protein